MDETPVRVAVAIVRDGRRVLVTRRPAGKHLGGLWEFPGGKTEPGETSAECAVREVREETGLIVAITAVIAARDHAYPGGAVSLQFLEAKPVGGALDPSLMEARWIEVTELPGIPMPAANEEVVRLLAGSSAGD